MKRLMLVLFMLVVALTMVGCASATSAADSKEVYLPVVPESGMVEYTGLVSAFGSELEAVKADMTVEMTATINGTTFYFGTSPKIPGKHLALFMTSVSMVNAAMTTQMALDHYKFKELVFSGIAGGVSPELNIGDVVIPDSWIQYQENVLMKETSPGVYDPAWHTSEYPTYLERMIQPVELPTEKDALYWFPVPETMIAPMQSISVTLEKCTTSGQCLTQQPKLVVGGPGGSSQSFLDNAAVRTYLYDNLKYNGKGLTAIDMESAAFMHVCRVNGINCLVVRSLSDLAGGGPGQNEIGTFFGLASKNAATVLFEVLKRLP